MQTSPSNLKIEAVVSSETSMNFYLKTRRDISDAPVKTARVNLKSDEHSSCSCLINWFLSILYLLTELSPSWRAANCAVSQELPSILWNPKVQYRVHKSRPLVPIMSHINLIYSIPSYLSKIHFNIVHPSTFWSSQWSLSFWLFHQYPINIPLLPDSCYMPRLYLLCCLVNCCFLVNLKFLRSSTLFSIMLCYRFNDCMMGRLKIYLFRLTWVSEKLPIRNGAS
jgi:hypothetical protein